MSYLRYLRKSRKDLELEATGGGDTLERHRLELDRLAERMHITIGATYEEVVSGDTIAARPQMQRLLREVESGLWEGVLVMEIERLARGDSVDQGVVARAFKYSGTLIVTPAKTYDPNNEFDEEYFEFGLFMSRREYKTIRRRLTAGVQAARREGKYTGGQPPYGYQKEKLKGEKGHILVPDPQTAPIVRDIFRWFVSGEMNLYQIAAHLNQLGIPRPHGGEWYHKTVSLLVRNPHYAGYTTSTRRPVQRGMEEGRVVISRPKNPNVELYEGRHEPLVTREDWDKAQALLALHKAPPLPRGKGQTNAFTGLIFCGECGSRMQRNSFSPGSKIKRAPIIFCMTKGCPTISHRYDEIEQIVLNTLHKWLAEYQLSPPVESGANLASYNDALRQNEAAVKKLEAREQRAFELVETGVYSPALYVERKQALESERLALAQQRQALLDNIASLSDAQRLRSEFVPKLRHALDLYPASKNAHEQNELLKTVISKIVYYKSERVHPSSTGNLNLQIFPLLPPPSVNV